MPDPHASAEAREAIARDFSRVQAKVCNWPHDGQWDKLVPALRAPYLAMADVALAYAATVAAAERERCAQIAENAYRSVWRRDVGEKIARRIREHVYGSCGAVCPGCAPTPADEGGA